MHFFDKVLYKILFLNVVVCIIQAKYHRHVRALSLVFFRVEWVLARFFDTVSKQRMIDFFLILKKMYHCKRMVVLAQGRALGKLGETF